MIIFVLERGQLAFALVSGQLLSDLNHRRYLIVLTEIGDRVVVSGVKSSGESISQCWSVEVKARLLLVGLGIVRPAVVDLTCSFPL